MAKDFETADWDEHETENEQLKNQPTKPITIQIQPTKSEEEINNTKAEPQKETKKVLLLAVLGLAVMFIFYLSSNKSPKTLSKTGNEVFSEASSILAENTYQYAGSNDQFKGIADYLISKDIDKVSSADIHNMYDSLSDVDLDTIAFSMAEQMGSEANKMMSAGYTQAKAVVKNGSIESYLINPETGKERLINSYNYGEIAEIINDYLE